MADGVGWLLPATRTVPLQRHANQPPSSTRGSLPARPVPAGRTWRPDEPTAPGQATTAMATPVHGRRGAVSSGEECHVALTCSTSVGSASAPRVKALIGEAIGIVCQTLPERVNADKL